MTNKIIKLSILIYGITAVLISCKKEKMTMLPFNSSEDLQVYMGKTEYVCISKNDLLVLLSPEVSEEYNWSTGDTTSSISVNTAGFYFLTTINPGDTNTYELEITECSSSVFVPNAFTPNGDGINDLFTPVGQGIKEISMIIYDVLDGKVVFKSEDVFVGWDGRNKKGKLMPASDYFFYFEYNTYDNNTYSASGTVTLLRSY